MSTVLSDRCPKCGKIIAYTSEATELQCPCGHRFLVVEFVSERLKMEKAQEDSRKAREALAAAEADKAALQNRLNGTLAALDGILGSQRAEDAKLEGILDSLKADRQTHDAMTALLHALRRDQQSGQDALSRLLGEVMKRQSGAAEKLAAVQELAARILTAQASGAEAVEQMQDEILERIEAFELKARERLALSNDFYEWSRSMQQADVQRLQALQSSSDALLQSQRNMTAKLDSLSQSIDHTRKAIDSGFDQLRRQRLDKLIALYHQATGLQIERAFEKAEDIYRRLLAEGGQDAQGAEIYWRMLLCHYGVEYQEENGKTIPIILRPDLTEPDKMQVRKDLFAHVKTEEQRAYYTERLNKIDFYLARYRKLRMDKSWQYDVFISVKQNDNGQKTSDSDYASDLYDHFKDKPALAAKHLRVFNSRRTKLPKGEEYEPYIITALMSAKLLIVVGSKPEYMNSRWVRNEWQRFQYLQEQDKAKTGQTERRLFCYFVDGMDPETLPNGLNPNAQGIMSGIRAGDELLDVVEAVFPGPAYQPTPSPARPAGETPEQIAENMEAWLKLRKYEQVIAKYKSIENTRPGMLTAKPLLFLYTLCAQNQVQTLEALAAKGPRLRSDRLYELAYENADEALRARLDALWKTEASTPEPTNHGGKKYMLAAACLALCVCLAAFVLPRLRKDTPADTFARMEATETAASTPIPTETVTSTPIPTETATGTPTPTETATGTPIPTETATSTPVPTPTAVKDALVRGATVDGISLEDIYFECISDDDTGNETYKAVEGDTLNWNDYPNGELVVLKIDIKVDHPKQSSHILEIYQDSELICKEYDNLVDAYELRQSDPALFERSFVPVTGEYKVYLDGHLLGSKKIKVHGSSPMSEFYGDDFNTFMLNGKSYTLPISVRDLILGGGANLNFDDGEILEPLKPGEIMWITLDGADALIVNDSNQEQMATDCYIKCIMVSTDSNPPQFSWRDITLGEPLDSRYMYAMRGQTNSLFKDSHRVFYDSIGPIYNKRVHFNIDENGIIDYIELDCFNTVWER